MARGHDKERKVRRLLEEEGWWTCRAAGSLGDADIVALRPGLIDEPTLGGMLADARLVEVKANTGSPFKNFQPSDRRDLMEAAERAGAEAWLCHWPPRAKPRWLSTSDWPEGARA